MPNSYEEGPTRSDDSSFMSLGVGWVPIDYLVMVKCLDPKGRIRYRELASENLHPVEAIGMLITMQDTMRRRLMNDARSINNWDDE